MANIYKTLFRGAAATGSTTLYTTPASTTTMVTSVVATNTAGAPATFTLTINGIQIIGAKAIPANDYVQMDLRQIIPENQILAGLASATTVNFHVTGLEMT